MALPPARARQILIASVVVAVCVRLAFGLAYWTDKPLTHDEREYLALAGSLAAGEGFAYDDRIDVGTGQRFGRAPGYPLFLALIGAGGAPDDVPRSVTVAQSIVGALGVWCIGLLAWRAAGPGAGALAAALAAVFPPLVFITGYALSETLYSTVALATALLLQRTMDGAAERRTLGLAAVGVACGAGALIRPAMVFFVPLVALWLASRRQWWQAAVVSIATAATIAPWTYRNLQAYDRPVLIASEGGITFWTGNHPLAIGEGDLAANLQLKRAELAFRQAHPGLSPEAMEPLYYRDALQHIRERPGWWASLVARKLFYLVVPVGPSYALHSTRYRLATTVPYLLLLPFAVAGARRLAAAPDRPMALFLLAASAILVCLIFFPQERFRIPVIDPTLIVCAAGLRRWPPS